MPDALPSVLVTGISGNLGRRLLPMLSGFRVVGVDFRPPETDSPLQFVQMDFSLESSCLEMIHLLREVRPVAVVHLAFVMDAVRTGILDRDRMWHESKRFPCMVRSCDKYLHNRIQFVHIDDVARLVKFILEKNEPEGRRLTVLNLAGRGGPLTYEQCVRLANAKLVRVPTDRLFALVLRILWNIKLSTIPPDVAPYITSDTVMDTSRLEEFLGTQYGTV